MSEQESETSFDDDNPSLDPPAKLSLPLESNLATPLSSTEENSENLKLIASSVQVNSIFIPFKSIVHKQAISSACRLYVNYHIDGNKLKLTFELNSMSAKQIDFLEDTTIDEFISGKSERPILAVISILTREELLKAGFRIQTES